MPAPLRGEGYLRRRCQAREQEGSHGIGPRIQVFGGLRSLTWRRFEADKAFQALECHLESPRHDKVRRSCLRGMSCIERCHKDDPSGRRRCAARNGFAFPLGGLPGLGARCLLKGACGWRRAVAPRRSRDFAGSVDGSLENACVLRRLKSGQEIEGFAVLIQPARSCPGGAHNDMGALFPRYAPGAQDACSHGPL